MVSVVVPCYQSAGHIRTALRALEAQRKAVSYEIVVVDSSTDGTDGIVEREFPNVRLLHFAERRTVGAARNIGVDAALGKLILFVDSDTIPCSTWIEQMEDALLSGGADGVCGSMSNGTPWSVTGSIGFYLEFFRFLTHDGPPEPARLLVGGNSGYRREIVAGATYAEQSVGEDMLFSWRLAARGCRLLFVPRASVMHLNRKGWHTVVNYQRQLGVGAYFYQCHQSPGKMRLLSAMPVLILLMPFAVMFWIGWSILRRRRIADLLRFVCTSPLCLVANAVWARSFYMAMRQAK